MPETTFERRGKKTFIIIFILRLLPSAFVLLATIFVAALRSPIIGAFGNSVQSLENAEQLYGYLVNAGLLLFLVSAVVGTIIALFDYYGLSYSIEENSFRLKEGVIHLRETSIPYRQVQNVDISRPLLYRLVGMSRMVILTAGHEDNDRPAEIEHDNESEAIIDLMDAAIAEKLQHELLERSHVQVIRNTAIPAIDLHTH